MPLRRDPLKELLDLQERMNRLFDQTLGRERLGEPALFHGTWVPLADMFETADAYLLEVELPGLTNDQVEIQTRSDHLLVRGERQPFCASRPDAFHRLERRHGRFSREFHFSEQVDAEGVIADFANGLLRLSVPKARHRPRQKRDGHDG